jgi:hypothetical protein
VAILHRMSCRSSACSDSSSCCHSRRTSLLTAPSCLPAQHTHTHTAAYTREKQLWIKKKQHSSVSNTIQKNAQCLTVAEIRATSLSTRKQYHQSFSSATLPNDLVMMRMHTTNNLTNINTIQPMPVTHMQYLPRPASDLPW